MAAADSSGSLFQAIADTSNADYVTVNLESGQAWLTSRLFILAALIPRVRPIKRIVFLSGSSDDFVGHASTAAVLEALARKYPWLAGAYVQAHVHCATSKLDIQTPLFGLLSPQQAGSIMTQYLLNVRGPVATEEWVNLGSYIEHAAWITPALVQQDLGRMLEVNAVKRDPAADAVSLAKTLLRHESAYVAVLDSAARFAHLVDRARALDRLLAAGGFGGRPGDARLAGPV
jgi:hypothetical protein